jgi:hypothetical protein
MRSLVVAYGAVAVFVLLLPLAGGRAKAQEPPADQGGRNERPDPEDKSLEGPRRGGFESVKFEYFQYDFERERRQREREREERESFVRWLCFYCVIGAGVVALVLACVYTIFEIIGVVARRIWKT